MKEFPVDRVLELACAAQRHNTSYLKAAEHVLTPDGKVLYTKWPNKLLILSTLGENVFGNEAIKPLDLKVIDEDRALAADIIKYFRKLTFAVVEGADPYYVEINIILNKRVVAFDRVGYIASLPTTYNRDYAKTKSQKLIKSLDHEPLADIGTELLDLDCEILEVNRSKNFAAWNYTAIIDNKLVYWMSSADLNVGPCVIVRAKVKDVISHWKHSIPTTRLNFVKAFQ